MEHKRYVIRAVSTLLVVLALVLGLLWWQANRIVDTYVTRQISTSLAAQKLVEQQHRRDISTRAELIADNQAFVGYVSQALAEPLPGMEVDTFSVVDLLEERRQQLGMDVIAVLNEQGGVIAGTSRLSESSEFGIEPLFVQARDSAKASNGLWLKDGLLMQIAIQPLAADGFNDKFLLVGMSVGYAMASEIAGVGEAKIALLAMEPQGQLVSASTLPLAEEKALASALRTADDLDAKTAALAGKHYRTVSTRLFDSDDGRLLVLVNSDLGITLLLPMMLAGLLALLASAFTLAWYWSRVEVPSMHLAELLKRAINGDYHLRKVVQGSSAVKRIAGEFNHLMLELISRSPR